MKCALTLECILEYCEHENRWQDCITGCTKFSVMLVVCHGPDKQANSSFLCFVGLLCVLFLCFYVYLRFVSLERTTVVVLNEANVRFGHKSPQVLFVFSDWSIGSRMILSSYCIACTHTNNTHTRTQKRTFLVVMGTFMSAHCHEPFLWQFIDGCIGTQIRSSEASRA